MKLFRKKDVRTEFLPSAIEIVETPEAPLGKFSIWAVFLVVVAVIVWSFGKVNEVSIARGRVIPNGNSNIVQSFASGTVKSIEVKEGDDVSEGQTLIILDDKLMINERENLKEKLEKLNANKKMLQDLKDGKNLESDKEFEELLNVQIESNNAIKESYLNDLENLDIGLYTIKEDIEKSQKNLDKEKNNLENLKSELEKLKASNDETSVDISIKESEITSSKSRIESLEESIKSKEDTLKVKENEKQNQILKHKGQISDTLAQLIPAITDLEKKIENIDSQLENLNIKSPVDGKLQSLAVNTVDGVVKQGDTLALVVPKNKELVVEAMILNKDIGFVEEGQKTQIKFDTFDFQRYGTIEGTITHVSPDADKVNNESLYKATIQLGKKDIDIDGKTMNFSPGMDVTCEIDTGERRIIDFFIPGIKDIKSSFNLR